MRIKIIFTFVLLIVIVTGGVFFFVNGADPLLSKIKCQWSRINCPFYAVHLSNGQVYFGHLSRVSPSTITMKDASYLEAYQAEEDTVSQSQNFAVQQTPKQVFRLVERGGEKGLATDHMLHINRSAVLFWEKLSDDSDIVNSIKAAGDSKQ